MPTAEIRPVHAGSSRRIPLWLLVATVVLLLLRIVLAIYESRNPPRAVDRMHWRTPVEAAVEFRTLGKPILYDFSAEWCAPCRRMEREIFANRGSATTLEGMFIPVQMIDRVREDGHNPPAVDSLMVRFGVQAFPTLVIFDPRAPDDFEKISGYPGSDPLLQSLRQAHMKTQMAVSRRLRGGMTLPSPDSSRLGQPPATD